MSQSKINILIDAVDNASKKLASVGKSVTGLAGKLTKLGDVAKIAGGMMLRDLVRGATGGAQEAIKLGGEIGTLEASFNRLIEASGSTAISLESLREATGGTVADVDLLKSANQALMLGLPTDEMNDLFESAIKLGHGMGIDALSAVDSLCTGLGRQSKLVLDNLGVVFQAKDAYEWYAEQLGKTATELTETEKKLGWQKYAMKKITEQAEILGDVTSESQKSQERWGATIKNLKTSFGKLLGPLGAITPALSSMMPLIGTMGGMMLPQLITKQTLAGASSKIMAAGQWLLNAAMSANPIMLVVLAIAALVAGFIIAYKKCKWFRDLVDGAAKVLKKVFGGAIKKAGDALRWLGRILGDFLGWLGGAWGGTWDAVASFVSDPIGSIQSSVQGLVDGMASKFQQVHEETGNKWKATWEAMKTIPVIGQVLTAVQGFADGLLGVFGLSSNDIFEVWDDMWTGIQNFISDPIGSIISGVEGLAADVIGAVLGIFDNIKGVIDGFVTAAFEWGANLIQSFIDGITSMASGVTDAVSNIGGGIANFLGIGSPAKKGPLRDLMEWGPNLSESFAEGILSGLPKVERAAEGVAASFEGLSVGGVANVAGSSAAGFGGVVINVNVKGAVDRRTAEYAARLMERRLRKVMVENTSPEGVTKMVRLRRARGAG